MKKMVVVLLVIGTTFSGGCSRRPPMGKWQQYEAYDGSYAASMPGTSTRLRKKIPTSYGDIELNAYQCTGPEVTFMTGFSDYSPLFLSGLRRDTKENIFVLAREGVEKKTQATLIRMEAGEVNKFYGRYPTRTYEWDVPVAEHPESRAYIVQYLLYSKKTGRMYLQQAALPMDGRKDYARAVRKFLDSFELHEF